MAGGRYRGSYNELSKAWLVAMPHFTCPGNLYLTFLVLSQKQSVGVKSFECGYDSLSQAMTCLLRHAGQKRGLYFTAGQINSRND